MSDTQGGAYGPRRLSWDQPAPADLYDHLHPRQEHTVTTTPTAEDQAAQALAGTPTPQLLRAAYALTHRIHEVDADPASTRWASVAMTRRQASLDLRTQRDLIDAEVLRRTGDR